MVSIVLPYTLLIIHLFNDNWNKKMLNIKHFWGLISIKLLQKTHTYDYIPFVMLKGFYQKFTFWKDVAKFVCNFKEPSQ